MTPPEDERARYRAAHHQARRRLPNWLIGIGLIVAVVFGLYVGFTKHIPFTSRGYQLKATFANSVNVGPRTPVRVAGVDVGEVTGVEADGDATTVEFTVSEDARPVASDATIRIRPRIFFEGNYFLDLRPGSPSAPELEDGQTIPMTQTATAVQFDEILTTLEKPIRNDLGKLLAGYGTGLQHQPTKSEDRGFEESVKGRSGAEALNLAFDYGAEAGKSSALVAEAIRGTEPGDLARMIQGTGKTLDALGRSEAALSDLVTNWNTFTGALAAQADNLSATLAELAPTLEEQQASLANFNRTLPVVRTWARELEPALAELPDTIEAGNPWLEQADPLLDEAEAGGLVRMLRQATPGLTKSARFGLTTLVEIRNLSECTSEVLVPTGDQVIEDKFSTGLPNYTEFFQASTNIAGESQVFDGNGPMLRLQPSIGDELVSTPDPSGQPPTPGIKDDQTLWGHTTVVPEGSQPQFGPKPPFKPDVRCATNDVPELNSGLGEVGAPMPTPATPPPSAPDEAETP